MPKAYLAIADGGDYAPVAERLALFWARFPSGRVVTELHSRTEREVTFRALLYRTADEGEPAATGWASEREGDGEVNAVACLENAETSAVGRALANLGFAARGSGTPAGARRPLVVRESTPRDASVDASLQLRAGAAVDALDLLGEAERAGLPLGKAAALRARLADPTIPLPLIERTERELRGWLAKRRGRGREG